MYFQTSSHSQWFARPSSLHGKLTNLCPSCSTHCWRSESYSARVFSMSQISQTLGHRPRIIVIWKLQMFLRLSTTARKSERQGWRSWKGTVWQGRCIDSQVSAETQLSVGLSQFLLAVLLAIWSFVVSQAYSGCRVLGDLNPLTSSFCKDFELLNAWSHCLDPWNMQLAPNASTLTSDSRKREVYLLHSIHCTVYSLTCAFVHDNVQPIQRLNYPNKHLATS